MVCAEAARTVATYRGSGEIFVGVVVHCTGIEGNQLVALGITGHAVDCGCRTDIVPLELVGDEVGSLGLLPVFIEILIRVAGDGIDGVLVEHLVVFERKFHQLGIVGESLNAYISVVVLSTEVLLGDVGVALDAVVGIAEVGAESEFLPEVPVCGEVADELVVVADIENLVREGDGIDSIWTDVGVISVGSMDRKRRIEDVCLIKLA